MNNKTFQKLITACILVITLSVVYYFVIYLPGVKNQERLDAINREQTTQRAAQDAAINRRNNVAACQDIAANKAIELLKTKAKLNPSLYGAAAKEEGMYLKPDYQSYYDECIEQTGTP